MEKYQDHLPFIATIQKIDRYYTLTQGVFILRGFPKHINTKQDVEVLLNMYPEETKAFLQKCIEESENWINPVRLNNGDIGVEDTTHCVRVDENGDRYQLTWGFDPGCKLARLGITVEEAEAMINDTETAQP